MQYSDEHLRYLRLLSQKYQTVAAAASEIIHIEALLRLPKGTEHFMSDLHGEHEAFVHILNSASGVIREKIDTVLGPDVPAEERAELATLVYYPNQKLPELKARQPDLHAWYRLTLLRLIDLCRFVSSKHTRDHVRRCLPQNCGYILDELLHAHFEDHDKDQYYGEIIESILRYDRADAYIVRFCEVIKRLAVDRLHIVGDLFDRGPRPDRILDSLMAHHQVDIQLHIRVTLKLLYKVRPKGKIRDKTSIHDIHMKTGYAGPFHHTQLLFQLHNIRRINRWCQTVHLLSSYMILLQSIAPWVLLRRLEKSCFFFVMYPRYSTSSMNWSATRRVTLSLPTVRSLMDINNGMSVYLRSGDLFIFVMLMVVAPRFFAIFMAWTTFLDLPS